MNMYEAVFARKSSRDFTMEKIEDRTLAQFEHFLGQLEPYKKIRTEFKIVSCLSESGEWEKSRMPKTNVKAPYYLLIASELKNDYLQNAGYRLQQAVLYLTARGIGTCYQGSAVFPEDVLSELELDYVIAVAFGRTKKEVHREPGKQKRLKLIDLAAFKEEPGNALGAVLEAAVASPSAYNAQPWRFVVYGNRIHLFCKKSLLFRTDLSDSKLIDMGIMMANLCTAAEEQWMDISFVKTDAVAAKQFKNNEYVATAVLKEKIF